MCGRYVSARTEPDLLGALDCARAEVPEPLPPRHNVAPTQPVHVVRLDAAGGTVLTVARWGLVPPWARDPAIGARLINARIETVATKAAFRTAVRQHRVLVPADGYYEWARPAGGRPRPFFVHDPDGAGLVFAGVAARWADPSGGVVDSVAIVTRPSSGVPAEVHDRMPLLLSTAGQRRWLSPAAHLDVLLDELAAEADRLAARLAVRPAHPAVGDVRQEGAHLTGPYVEAEPTPTLW